MINSLYKNRTAIYFGTGMEDAGLTELARLGARHVLLHYGQGSVTRSGLLDRVMAGLTARQIAVTELGGVQPNPTLPRVREGVALCRARGIDTLLAVGGGSVIDSAKAIAAGAAFDGDVLDLIEGRVRPAAALPLGVILTVPGAGSESSPAAVISDPARSLKLDFAAECLVPALAVLNPENTRGVGLFQTRCGILDAITHVCERYFTQTDYVEVSDRLCEGLIQSLIHYGRAVDGRLDDYGVRAEIMWACKLAHDDVAGVGRKQDWSSHVIANALGGHVDQPHGALTVIVMLGWMKRAAETSPARFVQFGQRIFGLASPTAAEAIAAFEHYIAGIGMPVRLSGLGVDLAPATLDAVVDVCARKNPSGTIGNFVRLGPNDVRTILETAR
ncbi:MAG TPA: iron-containing alcohol dehydrogenase [Rhodocyclaceae bacterium]|nr:iron-containing alcohol dehydrogenase [Rhodocyclaceae bacterium]HMW50793.1 iron-containing alcohol dehydrogenase [Rhodocyclaceae bacterium]HNF60427.1 iron-containing alcohol dehydrogenase [Rhodocyclaceae bacterium]